ncbi:hypothetical protein [Sinorhizobium meliloti]|uniref:hypothetical protein n=2 Tax=Rhizobium meliloti TaxID=382 RepID=UPI000B5AA866|nr:hypothetical protein [Sinorhizobium meliloti]
MHWSRSRWDMRRARPLRLETALIRQQRSHSGLASYTLVQDRFPTETNLRNRIAVSYAGMAAEAAVFGDRSVGSGSTVGSDVERATSIARRMVGSFGLGKTPIFLGTPKTSQTGRCPNGWKRKWRKCCRRSGSWCARCSRSSGNVSLTWRRKSPLIAR